MPLVSPPPFGQDLVDERKRMAAVWVRWWTDNFRGVFGNIDQETADRIAADAAETAARIADVDTEEAARIADVDQEETDRKADVDTEEAARITADADHVAAADPHVGYQLRTEKDQAGGYAGLDGGVKLAGAQQRYGTVANTACEGNDPRLTAAVVPTLASGVYTPNLFNTANLIASGVLQAQFMRVGNTMTVSGIVAVTPAIATQVTQLGISLPLFSNFGGLEDLSGVAFASSVAGQGAGIYADVGNKRATMQWIAGDLTNQFMHFIFAYQLI